MPKFVTEESIEGEVYTLPTAEELDAMYERYKADSSVNGDYPHEFIEDYEN